MSTFPISTYMWSDNWCFTMFLRQLVSSWWSLAIPMPKPPSETFSLSRSCQMVLNSGRMAA